MSNINIIGNGFDLYHGLPTRYYYFACHVLSQDEEFYDELAEMYGFTKGVMHQFIEELDRGIDDYGYWNEFERKLGLLSSNWIEYSLQDELDLEYPDAVDLTIDRSSNVEKIQSLLEQWINTEIDIKQNYHMVEKDLGDKKIDFSDTDVFISFNYTHTLEMVYEIWDVCHIHGEGNLFGHNDELIIGHGNDQVIQELKWKIKDLEEDDYDQPSRNRKNEYKSELDIINALKKPVNYCIENLRDRLNRIKDPDKIIVWGFSLSDVDAAYISEIRKKWPKCKWSFSYYDSKDIENINNTVKWLKFDKEQWDIFEFRNDSAGNIEDKIVLQNKINVYPTMTELLNNRKA